MSTISIRTALGSIKVELADDLAPITVRNFLQNVANGLFQGGRFYRATRRDDRSGASEYQLSLIQGGANKAVSLPGGIVHESTKQTGLTHCDGAISMARMEPGTASTEFFICVGDNQVLDERDADHPKGANAGYAVFGRVIEGMDVVKAIHGLDTGEPHLTEEEAADTPDWLRAQFLNHEVIIDAVDLN